MCFFLGHWACGVLAPWPEVKPAPLALEDCQDVLDGFFKWIIIEGLFGGMCAQLLSCVWLFVTPWTVAHQALMSMGLSR